MRKVRDHQTDQIFNRFKIPVNEEKSKILYLPNNDASLTTARALGRYDENISLNAAAARAQVDDIKARALPRVLVGLRCQGWQDDAYITEGWKKGDKEHRFCYMHSPTTDITQRKGSLDEYRQNVVEPCKQSSYLTFSLMLGLAGPMLIYARLSESVIFHIFGETTTGKTSCAQCGESISRSPCRLPAWNITPRFMEELAAERRDQLLTLNAAEKSRAKDQATILHLLTHEVSEGEGKGRSQSVQEWLPNQTSRSPVLTTGNQSGAAMARACGVQWDRQEEARFISIPVPAGVDGGIIDRSEHPGTEEQNRDLIERITTAARDNYGVALPAWVMRVNRRKDRIPRYIDDYVRRTGLTDAYHVRIAKKFGLVYAAGAIAAKTKTMPWDVEFVFDVVHRLMNRALANVANELTPQRAVNALRKASSGKGNLPVLKKRHLHLDQGPIVGFRFQKENRKMIALRREALPNLLGVPESSETIIRMLEKAGVIETGHGGKTTQQVPFTLVTAGGKEAKSLRMVVVDAAKLQPPHNFAMSV